MCNSSPTLISTITTRLASVGLLLTCATVAHAGFTPISINTNSYNQDVVVEATAPMPLNDQGLTATMDAGTNRSGNTFYEVGYNLNFTPTNSDIATGLPVHGSLVSSN